MTYFAERFDNDATFRERLTKFVAESNRIEQIDEVSDNDLLAHVNLLDTEDMTAEALERFVLTMAPSQRMRDMVGLDVYVGNHKPPPGDPSIRRRLQELAIAANSRTMAAWDLHVRYENLHPFTDGNGRSGRALWLWKMFDLDAGPPAMKYGFLHLFYYQTLAQTDRTI